MAVPAPQNQTMNGWSATGLQAREHAALWALGVSTLIVLLPLLVFVVLPQHPGR